MTILEDLKAGRLVVVPSEATRAMIDAGRKAIADERARVGLQYPDTLSSLAYPAMLTASPDHTAALVALVEGMREQNGALLSLREKDCADYVKMAKNAIDNLARALAAEAERDEAAEERNGMREHVDDVLTWLKDRELYDPRDYEVEGPDLADILTSHEMELCAQADTERSRRLAAEAERDALREALAAADAIRVAQRRYMADRGNEELGKAVGAAVATFDAIRALTQEQNNG